CDAPLIGAAISRVGSTSGSDGSAVVASGSTRADTSVDPTGCSGPAAGFACGDDAPIDPTGCSACGAGGCSGAAVSSGATPDTPIDPTGSSACAAVSSGATPDTPFDPPCGSEVADSFGAGSTGASTADSAATTGSERGRTGSANLG